MIGWYILGAAVLLLAAIWLLPVGISVIFGAQLTVRAKIGPVRLTLYPRPTEKKRPEKKEKADGEAKAEKKEKLHLTFADIRSGAPVVFTALKKALGRLRRRISVDPFVLSLILAADDPSEAAQMYGWANTAMWTFMPPLEQLLHMPDPHIHLGVDYQERTTAAEGQLGVKCHVGALLVVALTLAVPVGKWYLQRSRVQAVQTQETKTDTTGKGVQHG